MDTRDLSGSRPSELRVVRAAAALALAIALAACGSDDESGTPEDSASAEDVVEVAADDVPEDAPEDEDGEGDDGEAVPDAAEDEEPDDGAPASDGGGAAVTIGEETWSFTGVECYFADDLEGDEEFILVSTRDGIMLYLSIDGHGHYLELNDVDQPDDPRVDWYTLPDAADFITLSGTGVVANTPVTGFDEAGAPLQADARLTANCPG